MDLFLVLLFWGLMAWGIYAWAESKGRSGWFFVVLAVITPIIPAVILLFTPKTLEKQAEEQKALDEYMNKS